MAPRLSPAARGLLIDLAGFLFPISCAACRAALPGRWPVPVCADCRRRLVPVHGATCLLCRTASRDSEGFRGGRSCADPEHRIYRAWAAVQMVDPADRLVHALKFHDRPEVGALLALFMARRLRKEGAGSWDVLLPMPLHAVRERARGYNQSAEIAGRLASSLDAAVLTRSLVRVRATRPQADLDHADRAANVGGAFRLAVGRGRRIATHSAGPERTLAPEPAQPDCWHRTDRRTGSIEGLRCLLVDDVATTGHTLVAAIDALKEGAPEAIGAAVFALA